MRTVLFLNANSRQARDKADEVVEEFKNDPGPFNIIDVIVVRRLDLMEQHLKRLQKHKGMECVIVGSGDGTIISVINALHKRKDIVFGFLPLGTLNAFVRSLGLPADYQGALKRLKKLSIHEATLGEANDILFANIVAIGISARMSGTISDTTKKLFGPLAYAASTLSILTKHRPFKLIIENDGKRKVFKTHQVVISNGRYHGDKPISQKASAFKDQLVMTVFGASPKKRHYLSSIIRFRLQRHEEHSKTEFVIFKQARITTKPARKVEVDGEVLTKTPIDIRVIPNAIKVLR